MVLTKEESRCLRCFSNAPIGFHSPVPREIGMLQSYGHIRFLGVYETKGDVKYFFEKVGR